MPRRKKITEEEAVEIPVLPPFPTEPYDITVSFADGTSEVIKVAAKGRLAAIQTACHSYATRAWTPEKISQITGLVVVRP